MIAFNKLRNVVLLMCVLSGSQSVWADGKVQEFRKPRMGLLLLATDRFRNIGVGTTRGSFAERKERQVVWMKDACQKDYEVVYPGIVWDRSPEDVRRAIDSFTTARVDFVLEIPLCWGEDCAHNRFLRDMPPVPLLFAHLVHDTVNLKDTHSEDEFTEYLCNGSLVGALEMSGDNATYARPMTETAVGTWKEILERASPFGKAARARAILRESKIGLLSSYDELMWSTYVDPQDVFFRIGPELKFLSVAELADAVDAVPEDEARRLMEKIASDFEVKKDVDEAKFLASVRATIGMERLAKSYGLNQLVLNDCDPVLFRKLGLRPGFYPTPEAGPLVVTPEGDLGAGFAVCFLRLLTGNHVNFIEPFFIDKEKNAFAAGHAGPNDYTDPHAKTVISRDVRFEKTGCKYAGAPFAWFTFPPGRKTMFHCSQHGGHFVFAVTLIDCLPTEHFLASYPHAYFRAVGQTNTELMAKLMKLGVTQHYGIVDGDVTREIGDLVNMLGFECNRL